MLLYISLQKRLEKSREQRKCRFKLSALSVLRAARAQGRKLPDARRGGTGWVESLLLLGSTLAPSWEHPEAGRSRKSQMLQELSILQATPPP